VHKFQRLRKNHGPIACCVSPLQAASCSPPAQHTSALDPKHDRPYAGYKRDGAAEGIGGPVPGKRDEGGWGANLFPVAPPSCVIPHETRTGESLYSARGNSDHHHLNIHSASASTAYSATYASTRCPCRSILSRAPLHDTRALA